MLYSYQVVCAYCKREIEIKHTDDSKMKNKISHGICRNCKDKLLKELNDITKQRR